MHNPLILSDSEMINIAAGYGIIVNTDDVTQYKLLQVIYQLEHELSIRKILLPRRVENQEGSPPCEDLREPHGHISS
jgi:hypothetical protein